MIIGAASAKASGILYIPTFESLNAFSFDGSTKTVDTGISSPVTEGSISIWFKPTSIGSLMGVFGDRQAGVTNSISLYIETDGELRMNTFTDHYTGEIVNTDWFHIVYTWNGSQSKLYLNSSLVESYSEARVTSAETISFGSAGGMLNPFNGSMDQGIVFDRELIISEIEDIYRNGTPALYSLIDSTITNDAIVSYAMNSSDNSLTDLSTGGNNGLAIGGATSDGDLHNWQTS